MITTQEIDLRNKLNWDSCRLKPKYFLEDAISTYNEANFICYKKGKADALRNQGQALWLLADYYSALDICMQAVEEYKSTNSNKEKSDLQILLGAIYVHIGDQEKALQTYKLAVSLKQQLNDQEGEARALNSIGDLYMKGHRYEEAIAIFNKCLSLNILNKPQYGILIYNLGEANFHLKNYKESKEFLLQALELGKEIDFKLMEVYSLPLIAEIEAYNNQTDEALQLLKRALELAEELEAKDRVYAIYFSFYTIYKMMGDMHNALKYYESYSSLKDRVYNDKIANQINKLRNQYQTQILTKEAEIQKLKNIELQKAYDEIEFQKNEIATINSELKSSILYAKRIQDAILPDVSILKKYFSDYFIFYEPKDILSGDIYWFNEVDQKAVICLIDCTGHGVPGAMLSVLANSFLNQIILKDKITTPCQILSFLDKKLNDVLGYNTDNLAIKDGMDISILTIEPDKSMITFAGARQNLYMNIGNELIRIQGTRVSIDGDIYRSKLFNSFSFRFQKGNVFFLSSDGLFDQFGGEKDKRLTFKRCQKIFPKFKDYSFQQKFEVLIKGFENWKGSNFQIDDVTVIGFEV